MLGSERTMKKIIWTLLITLTSSLVALDAYAGEWGSLKGRFVFTDTPVSLQSINVNKDAEFCSKNKLVEENLLVGEKGGLSNVFVYLYLKKGKKIEVHPDLAKPDEKPVVLYNKGCRFEPHTLTVRTSQTLEIRNSDPGIGHNTNATTLRFNPRFNDQVSNDEPLIKVFEKAEYYPAEIACNVHPWMKAYVLIRDNPYMTVSDAKGNFEIKNIPAGKRVFSFWQESKGNLRDLSVGKTKTSRKGQASLEIVAGETLDLGEIKVSAQVLGL